MPSESACSDLTVCYPALVVFRPKNSEIALRDCAASWAAGWRARRIILYSPPDERSNQSRLNQQDGDDQRTWTRSEGVGQKHKLLLGFDLEIVTIPVERVRCGQRLGQQQPDVRPEHNQEFRDHSRNHEARDKARGSCEQPPAERCQEDHGTEQRRVSDAVARPQRMQKRRE